MKDDLAVIDVIEALSESLSETKVRLAATEDMLFFMLKLTNVMDEGEPIVEGIRFLAKNRLETGSTAIAAQLEQTANAIEMKSKIPEH